MEEQKKYFLESAAKNKLDKKLSIDLWMLLEKFAQYGFNKSHSAAYALIAYRTGYLKVKHPAEFMAATATSEMTDTDRLKVLIKECKRMGLEIVSPDIKTSKADFTTDGNKIFYALAAIKNVGVKAANSVIKAVEENTSVNTIFDLVKHIDLRLVNKKVLESLACSGAFDSLEGKRSAKFESVGRALEFAQKYQSEQSRGQTSLFGGKQSGTSVDGGQPNLHNVEEWSDHERIENELSAFGFHLIEHPLEKYAIELNSFTNHVPGKPLNEANKVIKTGGTLIDVKVHFDRNNKQMAFCQLEGMEGTTELLVFTEVFERYKDLISKEESMVLVSGKLSTRDNSDPKIVASEFVPLQGALETLTGSVMVKIDLSTHSPEDIERVGEAAEKFKGNCGFGFLVASKNIKVNEILSSKISVKPDRLLFEAIDEILGPDSIVLKSAK